MFDLNAIVRKNILNLKPYASARDEYKGKEGIFLDANENPYGTLNRYPDPYQMKLKEKLSALKGVPTENMLIGNGSDEIIDLAFRIFCTPSKDKALTFSPSYGMYDVSAAINDIELIKVPLNDDFNIDMDAVSPYLSDECLKLIFVCSPNNPSGNCIQEEGIDFLLKNFKGIVIVDEAYVDFSSTPSWNTRLANYPNLLVSQTFSKAWGLAAARVGIGYASRTILTLFNNVKPPYNVSAINQQAAIDALDNYAQFQQRLKNIVEERGKLRTELEKIDIVRKIYPSDSNFLLVEVVNAQAVYDDLIAKQIIVRNRHKLVNNCIRITVGTPEENQRLIEEIREMR